MTYLPSFCLGCGGDDQSAAPPFFRWLVVDRARRMGVCTRCPDSYLKRWQEGLRAFSVTASYRMHHGRVRKCRTCDAPIVWLIGPYGHRMPVDVKTVLPEERRFCGDRHICHFDTCTDTRYRRRRA